MRRFLSSKASSSLRGGAAARAFVFDLNKGINDCTSFRELESLLFTLDKRALGQGPVLGNAVLRMGKLRSVERSITDDYVHKSSVVVSLIDLCCSQQVKFPNISSVFHGLAMGKLSKQIPAKLIDQLESDLQQLRPNQLATCVFSMATLQQTGCGTLLQTIEQEICSPEPRFPLTEFTPEQLVYLGWGFTSLRNEHKADRFFAVLLDHLLEKQMVDFTVPQLTHLVWAYSHDDLQRKHELYRVIKDELLGARGGWRAVRNANAMAGMVISFANVFDLKEGDFVLAIKDLSHNRNVKDIDSDMLLGLVECFAARRQTVTATFFQSAAQELIDRHFRGLDSTQIVSLLYAYTVLGNYSCPALFDKAAKELVKPKHWKPCRDARLAFVLANLPLPHPQHVTTLVQKLTLEHIQDRKQWLQAAWSLAALGRKVDVPDQVFSDLCSSEEEDIRMAQELILAVGKDASLLTFSSAENDKEKDAIQARLKSEFREVKHIIKQINFPVDFYLPTENAVVEFARNNSNSNSPASTFRHRLLKQHVVGCRIFVLPRITNKPMATLDAVMKQICTNLKIYV